MLPFRNQISERFAKLQYIFTDDKNKEIQFNSGEKKSKLLNFQIDIFLK